MSVHSSQPAKPLRPELARLPRGRHGLPREFVVHNQRERLIVGIAYALAERGYADTTIADVVREAAVSRRVFYEHFETKEQCFLAAYEAVIEGLRERIAAAREQNDDWVEGLRAGIASMLRFLASEPELARLCTVEAFAAGPRIAERHRAAVESLIPLLHLGRRYLPVEQPLPQTTEEAVLGGMMSLISRQVAAGDAADLERLLPDLVRFALTPYLGAAEAERVATAA